MTKTQMEKFLELADRVPGEAEVDISSTNDDFILFASSSMQYAPEAVRELMEAVELLKEVEWIFNNDWGYYYCSICKNVKEYGHKKDCKLSKFLEAYNEN